MFPTKLQLFNSLLTNRFTGFLFSSTASRIENSKIQRVDSEREGWTAGRETKDGRKRMEGRRRDWASKIGGKFCAVAGLLVKKTDFRQKFDDCQVLPGSSLSIFDRFPTDNISCSACLEMEGF